MKRTPIRRSRRGIPARSRKRTEGDEAYFEVRAEYLAEHPRCEFKLAGASTPCFGPINIHHRLPLGQGGVRADPCNFAAACNYHNEWAEEGGRAWSLERGLLRKRSEDS
jgi:hypothetical protein